MKPDCSELRHSGARLRVVLAQGAQLNFERRVEELARLRIYKEMRQHKCTIDMRCAVKRLSSRCLARRSRPVRVQAPHRTDAVEGQRRWDCLREGTACDPPALKPPFGSSRHGGSSFRLAFFLARIGGRAAQRLCGCVIIPAEHVFTNLQDAMESKGGFIQFSRGVIQDSQIVPDPGVLATGRAAHLLCQLKGPLVLETGFDKIPENAVCHCQVVPQGRLNSWGGWRVLAATQSQMIDGFCLLSTAGLSQANALLRMLFPDRMLAEESNPDRPEQARTYYR